MQPAPGPLSERPEAQPPLPPALTRHSDPALPSDAGTLLGPFVPDLSSAFPDAAADDPWEVAPGTGTEPSPFPAQPHAPTEPVLPWEEYLSLDEAAPAGTAEPVESAPWEEWTMPPAEETGVAVRPWGDEGGPEAASFPLDAFIVPLDARQPAGTEIDERARAEALASRLEALAARLRVQGFAPLVEPGVDAEPIDRLLAALLAGYLSR